MVTQRQARQDIRRNMSVSYLLDAYRRLERASNRPLTSEVAGELEAAVADVMLLGTRDQAGLADDFARIFAAQHVADTQPLLLALRDSLRGELLLDALPQDAYISLRINADGDTASETAHIWRETTESTRRSVTADLDEIESTNLNRLLGQTAAPGATTKPYAAVAASAVPVELLLRELLAGSTDEEVKTLPMPQLAIRALQLGLIDTKLADSINGLSVMRILAEMDHDRLTEARAAEFTTLAMAIEYLLQMALRRRASP